MKRILILLSVVAIFASCSKEKTQAELIVGEWHATSFLNNGVEELNANPATTNVHAVFNADLTGTGSSDASNDTFTYTISSTNLVLNFGQYSMDWTINTLNETTLDITYAEGTNNTRVVYDKH